jgi:hypothetical protein
MERSVMEKGNWTVRESDRRAGIGRNAVEVGARSAKVRGRLGELIELTYVKGFGPGDVVWSPGYL